MAPAPTPLLRTAAAVTSLLAIGAVIVGGRAIVAHPSWSASEITVMRTLDAVRVPLLEVVARVIDVAFGPSGAPMVVLIVLAWALQLGRSWQGTLRMAVLIVGPWAVVEVVKQVVRRPRPDPAALGLATTTPSSFSFPSGHTAFAAALCAAIVLILAVGRARAGAVVAGVSVVLATAWSRVYLGVHFPSDVVASLILAPAIAFGLYVWTSGWELARPSPVRAGIR